MEDSKWRFEDEDIECLLCGATETVELHSPDGNQSITICAVCGSDE